MNSANLILYLEIAKSKPKFLVKNSFELRSKDNAIPNLTLDIWGFGLFRLSLWEDCYKHITPEEIMEL